MVAVRLELCPELEQIRSSAEEDGLRRRLTAQLEALLDELGVPGKAAVELATVQTSRPVRVAVNGRVRPYPPELLLRTWLAVAPAGRRNVYELSPPPMRPPLNAGWILAACADRSAQSSSGTDWKLLATYLERFAMQVVLERPSCLLDGTIPAFEDLPVSGEDLSRSLRWLLDLGVAIGNHGRLEALISEGAELRRPLDDTMEAAFTELRSHRIAIHVHPATLAELLPHPISDEAFSVHTLQGEGDRQLQDLFSRMEATFYSTFGFILPDLVWVPNRAFAERTVGVKIGKWSGLPIPMLPRGRRLVDAPPEELDGFDATAAMHPLTGARCSLVRDDAKEALEQAGRTTLGPLDFVLLNVLGEVSQRPRRLYGLEELEFQLTTLSTGDEISPLVDATLARYSLGDITRVRRALIAERLGLRGLPLLLEALLAYSTVPIDDAGVVVLDDRLPVGSNGRPAPDGWPSYYAFVRTQLKPYIRHKYVSAGNSIVSYRLGATLENRLRRLPEDPFSDSELELLRDQVWKLQTQGGSSSAAVVVASTTTRPRIRSLLEPELPQLPVVAYAELGPDVRVEDAGTIIGP